MKDIFKLSLLFSLLLTVGASGYYLIEGWSILNSLYMTLITLTTIGFQEIEPLSERGRIFTIFLIIIGVSSMAYILSQLFQNSWIAKPLREKKNEKENS
jgi:voltage-gated potassium channel